MLDELQGFHLELTNKCMLKCHKCDRTEFINRFGIKKWKNLDLNLEDLKSFLDIDLTGKRIEFVGTTGDAIYHSEFLDIVAWFKSKKANLLIVTNGSYKSESWWEQLADLLDDNDSVAFSIDGTPENFTKYRVNADWPSIEVGIKTLVRKNIQTIWKYIVFAYNENTIEEARELSKNLGVSSFELVYSSRWTENDDYKPVTFAKRPQTLQTTKKLVPICRNNKSHYISASGYYSSCCYMSAFNFYYKTEFYKNKDRYAIKNNTLSEILSRSDVKEFYETLEDRRHPACVFNCTEE